MKFLSPVVWSEGMHLAQHHFQAQNRYFEELTAFAVESLFFRSWGLLHCELDAEALLNGTVSLTHARGTMPDGLHFHFPEDEPPAPLEIGELFSPVQESHHVLLAIPAHRMGQANCALPDDPGDRRFRSRLESIPDELTGADEKQVEVGGKSFRLLLDHQPQEGMVVLPIARIRRDGRGHFLYDADYVPPCLQIGASEKLLQITARLVEILDAKSDALALERKSTQRPLAEWAGREIASFWLTHAVHAASSPLRHLLQTRSVHPERLYVEMSRLAGALCTFSLDAHPRDLPAYDHEDLAGCFDVLDAHIRKNLEIVLPSNTVVIPLQPAGQQYFFTATVPDERCFRKDAYWHLGVRSSAKGSEIAAGVPRLAKLCSAEHIMRLVKEGLPGLSLEHVPSPPSEISPRLGSQYFRLHLEGPCWTLMAKANTAGVYLPGAIPDPELELTIVLPK
ncbi:MAG: type VI secretion system baseplate subunit TssK [Gemmatimonadota bacterium]|jgi:type VI secretion system protein ImpJ